MTNINSFQALINSAFPTLNAPACDSCGAPSTHAVYESGDASVGYGDAFVEMCDECDGGSR